MKKLFVVVLLVLTVVVFTAPVYATAGGGKVQWERGDPFGPGSDSQDNQVDGE